MDRHARHAGPGRTHVSRTLCRATQSSRLARAAIGGAIDTVGAVHCLRWRNAEFAIHAFVSIGGVYKIRLIEYGHARAHIRGEDEAHYENENIRLLAGGRRSDACRDGSDAGL